MSHLFASIGECMIELAPAEGGLYHRGFAGDTFNTAWTVRALSASEAVTVRYVTAVGDDAISADLRRFIAGAGIDDSAVRVVPGKTAGLYMISLVGAERSFTYWRETSAAKLLAADPDALAAALKGIGTAYLSGITLAILSPEHREALFSALRQLRAAGGRVVFDPNVRLRLWPDAQTARSVTTEGYRNATIALPTYPDERDLFGDASPDAAADRIAALGVEEMVLKDGPEPALVVAGGKRTTVGATAVASPVDTTGAGDAFNAGYLAARIAGRDPVEAARLAHAVAGRVITVRGALMPMADLSDLAVG